MFTQADLDEAVEAGALSSEAADGLRAHLEVRQATPAADEEHFRLLTGFNDIFVSIAALILLFAVGFIGQTLAPRLSGNPHALSPTSGVLVAASAWGLALFFTAKRRMALPSILLLLAFVGGLFSAAAALGAMFMQGPSNEYRSSFGLMFGGAALVAAAGAYVHWLRFKVPITVAAGAAAMAVVLLSLLASALGRSEDNGSILLGFSLLLGLGIFLIAMRWDSSDPQRVTRRSDVAFWLHLLAAPMIVHPVFSLLGLTSGTASVGEGLLVILLYVVLGVTALAIDRRALLVSALAYVLYALSNLLREFGAVEINVALTALVIGSALLLLSAFWHQARRLVVDRLPDGVRRYLPATDRPLTPQPAA